jgi:hypothetical protein
MPPMVTLPKQFEPSSGAYECADGISHTDDTLDLQTTLGNFEKILKNTVNFGVRIIKKSLNASYTLSY